MKDGESLNRQSEKQTKRKRTEKTGERDLGSNVWISRSVVAVRGLNKFRETWRGVLSRETATRVLRFFRLHDNKVSLDRISKRVPDINNLFCGLSGRKSLVGCSQRFSGEERGKRMTRTR